MDDRVLVYRGADQPDMSVINPESDVWQHVKVCMRSVPFGVQLSRDRDSPCVPVRELAHPLFRPECGRAVDRSGWSTWTGALQYHIGPMEAFRG